MTQQTINIGTTVNDGTGDPLRTAFTKINANFTDLYTSYVTSTSLTSTLSSYALSSNVTSIPSQTNNGGAVLTTNGTSLSWAVLTSNSLTNGSYTATLSNTGNFTIPGNIDGSASTSTIFATPNTSVALLNAASTLTFANGATTLTLGYNGTSANSTTNINTASVANTITKTVNIGTNGATGSTTNINIGTGSSGTVSVTIGGVTTYNGAVKFNGALQSGGGATNITLSNNGPTLNGTTTVGIVATAQTAGTIGSATTIAPTNPITFISGTTQITTITPPSGIATYGGQITLIPTGIWTTSTSGNIALASTAVVSKAMIMTYDGGTSKWYPSY